MCAVLELAGEQRRADEETDQGRQRPEPPCGGRPAAELALEVPDDQIAAGTRRRGQAPRDRVAVVRRVNRQTCGERGGGEPHEQPEPGVELGPVLPPRNPCHRSGSLSGGVGSVGAGTRPGAM